MIAAGLVLASAAVLRAAAEPHNGGFAERLVEPAAGTKPHVLWLLIDDYGWAELGAHRSPPSPCAPHGHPLALFAAAALCSAAARCAPMAPALSLCCREVLTPNMDGLIDQGILFGRHYVCECSELPVL